MEKTKDRVILHCDCNSFFASVETVLDPSYAHVPMAVCGSSEDRHGIVLAKNELAKKFGIQTAETVWSAKRKCPNLVIAEPHHEAYADFSNRINEIYDRYTDQVEPFSVDESWLDVTGSRALFGDGKTIADEIRSVIRREIGVTVSVGVSFNKIFAKMGSDYKKPDATTVITRDNFRQIIHPLPVEDMIYVGRQIAASLRAVNIRTVGDLAAASRSFLVARFGKQGELLHDYANGIDDSPVAMRTDTREAKSVGNGMTFRRDLVTEEEIRVGLEMLCEEVAHRLRIAGQKACTLSVSIKDTMLQTLSRQAPLDRPTDLARELSVAAFAILQAGWNMGRPIRALTVTAMQLVRASESYEPISFFDGDLAVRREKNASIENTVDSIRHRFGNEAITSGAVLGNDFCPRGARQGDNKKAPNLSTRRKDVAPSAVGGKRAGKKEAKK